MSELADSKNKLEKPRFRKIRRVLKISGLSLISMIAVILFAIAGIYYHWSRNSLAVEKGEIKVVGLQSPVSVRRDERGIPYLTAENRKDLYFAQGYVTAQDRLWQMDLLRRTATGRLSELFGNRSLEFDKRQRNYGFRQISENTFEKLSPEIREVLQSYADGVNAFIEHSKDNLPLEFRLLQYEPELWKPSDSIAAGKLMAQTLAGSWEKDLMRGFYLNGLDEKTLQYFLPEVSPLDQIIVGTDETKNQKTADSKQISRIEDLGNVSATLVNSMKVERDGLSIVGLDAELPGSNNWVVSGQKTTTGKPFLANDPHLGFGIPSVWHQVDMKLVGENLHFSGVTFPGTPGIVIGHNGRIAWGVTNAAPDVQDIYSEEFSTEKPNLYRVGTTWREAEIRTEIIKVRQSNFSPASADTVHEVISTRHGPIVGEKDGKKFALRWTGLDEVREFSAYFQINYAANWDDFRQSLKNYPGPAQNFVYADTQGNIGYYLAAFIPKRKTGDGSIPVDGTIEGDNWDGFIPFEELPNLYNPPQGWIATANNRVIGNSYKHFLGREWSSPYRIKRINDLIREKEKLSHEDMRRIQADVYSTFDYNFARAVRNILTESKRSEEMIFREIVETADKFDGNLLPENTNASIIVIMRENLSEKIAKGKLGENFKQYRWFNQPTGLEMILRDRPPELLPAEFTSYEDLIAASYSETIDDLTKRFGDDRQKWTWGKVNQINLRHPLGIGPLEYIFNPSPIYLGGNGFTVNCNYKNWGVSMRMIANLSNLEQTTLGLTLGQSGQNADSNYDDQLDEWEKVKEENFSNASGNNVNNEELLKLLP